MQEKFTAFKRKGEQIDSQDVLASFRSHFLIPVMHGKPAIYFTGNSLGLQPVKAREYLMQELSDWEKWGVEGHFHARNPWVSYHEPFSDLLAHLAGAESSEVVAMGSLTANLHFLMASFYQPTAQRYKILCEKKSFPSDLYALRSQARFHGFNPDEAVVELPQDEGTYLISDNSVVEYLEKHGHEIALVMLGGVNYFTGQVFDMKRITEAAHRVGAYIGWDLAHAMGNVRLELHDWNADFAAWCTYKYLNSGPGAVGGIFVHKNHHANPEIPRLEGWWGTNKEHRFKMYPEFEPIPTAEAWQHSNAPVLNMAVHRAALELFQEAGQEALLQKSRVLWNYTCEGIQWINERAGRTVIEIITPVEEARHGCQLSLVFTEKGKAVFEALLEKGVITDWREPNVIRIAPVPLYNSCADIFSFIEIVNDLIH